MLVCGICIYLIYGMFDFGVDMLVWYFGFVLCVFVCLLNMLVDLWDVVDYLLYGIVVV